jgi:hypothetical protein
MALNSSVSETNSLILLFLLLKLPTHPLYLFPRLLYLLLILLDIAPEFVVHFIESVGPSFESLVLPFEDLHAL